MKTSTIIGLLIMVIVAFGCRELHKETKTIVEFMKGDEGVKVDGVLLKYQATDSLMVAYDAPDFALNEISAEINLTGSKVKQAKLEVSYWEYEPGDAKISIEGNTLKLGTASGKPAHISKVVGSMPEGISLSLTSVSGDVSVNGFNSIIPMELNTTSGAITLENSNAFSINLKSVSGDMKMARVKVLSELAGSSTSGEVNIHDSQAKKLSVNTISGDIMVTSGNYDSAEVNSTSGNISIQSSKMPARQISSVSGKITESK